MKKFIYILTMLLILVSCEKDANIEIEEMPAQLVVSSLWSNDTNFSTIQLTMSKGFNRQSREYQHITDAEVKVVDSQANVIVFTPNSDGVYKTTTTAVPNETYTLYIKKAQYQLTAQAKMPSLVVLEDFKLLDPIYDFARLIVQFQDPSPETDYYKVLVFARDNQTSNNEYLLHSQLISDYNYDTQTHQLDLGAIQTGGLTTGVFKTVLIHLNKDTYDYYQTLSKLGRMGYGDSPFVSAVPGNPNTNLHGGIGFFATGAISIKEKLIQN